MASVGESTDETNKRRDYYIKSQTFGKSKRRVRTPLKAHKNNDDIIYFNRKIKKHRAGDEMRDIKSNY